MSLVKLLSAREKGRTHFKRGASFLYYILRVLGWLEYIWQLVMLIFILANTNYKKEALDLLGNYISQKRGQIINFRQDPSLETLREFDEFHQLHISNFIFHEEAKIADGKDEESNPNTVELDRQMKKLMD